MRRFAAMAAMVFLCFAAAQRARAADKSAWKAVAPFLSEKTIAVADLDAAAIDMKVIQKHERDVLGMAGLEKERLEQTARRMDRDNEQFSSLLQEFAKAGGSHVVWVMDFPLRGTIPGFAVLPLKEGEDGKALGDFINKTMGRGGEAPAMVEINEHLQGAAIGNSPLVYVTMKGALVIGTRGQVQELAGHKAVDRPDLAKAFAAAGEGGLRAAFVMNDALLQAAGNVKLPPIFGNPDVPAALRAVAGAHLAARLSPAPSADIVIQATDEKQAAALGKMVKSTKAAILEATANPGTRRSAWGHLAPFVPLIDPVVKGDQLVLELSKATVEMLETALSEEMAWGSLQSASFSNLRQIGQWLMLYVVAHKGKYPASLDELTAFFRESGTEESSVQRVLTNPKDPTRKPGYVYIVPPKGSKTRRNAETLVGYEAFDKWPGIVNVGFMDGHVDAVADQDRFDKLLKAAKSGDANDLPGPVTRPATQSF
ncbi:MAG TPA: hypothetical protein VIL86_04280 [Tepidisphaeraceae bacterium]